MTQAGYNPGLCRNGDAAFKADESGGRFISSKRSRAGDLMPNGTTLEVGSADFLFTQESFNTKLALGEVALKGYQQGYHDPNAHLYARYKSGSWEKIEAQMDAEIESDIIERDPKRGIYFSENFEVTEDDFISSTGLSMNQLLSDGLKVARESSLESRDYLIAREEAHAQTPNILRQWLQDGGQGQLVVSSLCPPESELSADQAKSMNYKPDYKMSIISVYKQNDNGIAAEYFSVDNHTLESHQELLSSLGYDVETPATTLELLKQGQQVDNNLDLRSTFREHHGNQIVGQPDQLKLIEIKNLYRQLNMAIYAELGQRPSAGLVRNLSEMGININQDNVLNLDDSSNILELFRSQIAPHYVYDESDGTVTISGAGQQAISGGISYQGACPTSADRNEANGSSGFLVSYLERRQVAEKLRKQKAGIGVCALPACFSRGDLWGCGLCQSHNDKWCDEYEMTGRMLWQDKL